MNEETNMRTTYFTIHKISEALESIEYSHPTLCNQTKNLLTTFHRCSNNTLIFVQANPGIK